ncbi:hypothetical protein [Chitinophaga sp.]|uniref:hypothetical protein n=1 Tax=Chitinophaga sp. TaxID=1869181 RepID=UPI0031E433AD
MKIVPPFRKLRGYTFDPALSSKMETASINQIVYNVLWEDLEPAETEKLRNNSTRTKKNESDVKQGAGPVGEYLEIIDYDPTTKKFYKPVNLNETYILAQDGLDPSESNPMFHQQMVYAVAMTTIMNFERSLGRKIIWASRHCFEEIFDKKKKRKFKQKKEEYVQRLRIYPHALREANAYYSPQKKALLFGYFNASPANVTLQMPGAVIFTCLNHDIIAHEVTHAIIDGLHRHYNEPTNPDVHAFHEAFADIVALFQHFTFTEVLKDQISKTRGDIGAQQSLLGEIAQEFGYSMGKYGSLRMAIGKFNEEEKRWEPAKPDGTEYQTQMEPHARGSILVAAVFEAFINIYKKGAADLLRIYTNGSGVLPEGELHPDLVNRLATEASRAAKHVLGMCIRALDYLPPVDVTFGDFLRGIITADVDLVKEDVKNYRLAFIEAFKKRGIYPEGIRTMSVDSLRYRLPVDINKVVKRPLDIISEFLKKYRDEIVYVKDRKKIYDISRRYMSGKGNDEFLGLEKQIDNEFNSSNKKKIEAENAFEVLTGLIFFNTWKKFGNKTEDDNYDRPPFAVQQLRLVSRVGPDGSQINQIVFAITQRSELSNTEKDGKKKQLVFSGGCTLIFDMDTMKLKYAISKPLLDLECFTTNGHIKLNMTRIEHQYNYQVEHRNRCASEYNRYFEPMVDTIHDEPFALLHKH